MPAVELFNLVRKDTALLDACTTEELVDLAEWALQERQHLLQRGLSTVEMVDILLEVSAAACERLPEDTCLRLN